MKRPKIRMLGRPGFNTILSSVVSILFGLLAGFLLLVFFNASKSVNGFEQILTNGLATADKMAKVLYQAAPLIMTGLSVGFAFKTGLFNIGASGQYLMGAFFGLYTGVVLQWPWWAALLAAMLGGAFWGLWPGLFKALFNVNEVITSIMFNWIGLFLVNLLMSNIPKILSNYYGGTNSERSAELSAANPAAIIPKWGLDKLFDSSSFMNISIFLAIIMAIIIHIVLNKTTFGYQLKACGLNRNASIYAGINAKRNIVLSMVIAGAMAGIGGGLYYLSGNAQYTIEKLLLPMGFNGIPVALLATSSPIGIIFSGLFVSYIQVGGNALQPTFVKEIIDIIISVIIYMSAFALLIKGLIAKLFKPKKPDRLTENNKEDVK